MKSWEELIKKVLKIGVLGILIYATLIFLCTSGVYAVLCIALGWKFRWWIAILIYILTCWIIRTA